MVSVCLPSDALLQHLPSYLGFSYLGRGVSLHGCFSKAQPLLLTLDEAYLLPATVPDLQCGIAPLGPPVPVQPLLLGLLLLAAGPGLGRGWLLLGAVPSLGLAVAPQGRRPWPWAKVAPPSCSLGLGVAPQGHHPWPQERGGFSWLPLTLDVGCLLLAATGLGRGVAPLRHRH